jgi:tRNA modification GTPase
MSAGDSNRAILLTPPGAAAIAVVRVAGPRVKEFFRLHFAREVMPSRAVHGELRDGDAILDDCLVVVSGDGSFVDINLHGGAWVVTSVLELLRRDGFEILSGEPPLPADLMDGETLLEREVAAYLPLARTEQAIRILLAQPRAWRDIVARKPSSRDIQKILEDRSLHHLLHPPRVAIVGAANVGKSTLANQLFAQQRSITADVPGTTRDWVGEIANIDGLAVMLVDTPGVRLTEDAIEREAIERSGKVVVEADLIVHVMDATAPVAPTNLRPNALVVLNKVDRINASREVSHDVETVATTGRGVEQLRQEIRRFFGCDELATRVPRWWTERQRECLARGDVAGVLERSLR